MDGQSLIDMTTFDSLKELLGDSFSQLIETYINDSQVRVEKLSTAIPERDFEVIRHESHGLKGSSRNLGIFGLGDVCEKVENDSNAKNGDSFEQDFAAIEQQFAAVSDYLKSFL